ncbi:UPF0149 family protein [Labrys wisconsinensis]|uniref:YecA family protein n=1 Tax=Labrys wisconsinensis TaxID=425677 RepID=A0ABU0JB27_9HYPH|nr:UPF0149 family protein [Labrys wisconsinensis]MDQ0470805.1 uncharacterized protein [Labrys wisconsinensis]
MQTGERGRNGTPGTEPTFEDTDETPAALAELGDYVPESAPWVRLDEENGSFPGKLTGRLKQLDRELVLLPFEEPMLISELDGFVAGLLVSPNAVPPAEWLPLVWGADGENGEGDEPAFERTRQAEKVVRLVMQHHDAVAAALAKGGLSYEPIFDIDPRNDDVLWEPWVVGFMKGYAVHPPEREDWLSGDEEAESALSALVALAAIDSGESLVDEEKAEELTQSAPDIIPLCVEALHAWKAKQPAAQAASMPVPHFGKVGRNDPCPCGSGRKYKKCCRQD